MLQNLDRVKETFSAVLMITKEDGKTVEMQAFERELREIAQIKEDNIKEEHLLEGNPFSFKINPRDIITTVWRRSKRHHHHCLASITLIWTDCIYLAKQQFIHS